MNQQVAIIREDPFGLVVAFDAEREFAALLLQFQAQFVGNGLNLALIRAGADHEVIRERGDSREIQHPDIGGLFRFGRAYRGEPVGDGGGKFGGFGDVSLQRALLLVSYYNSGPAPAGDGRGVRFGASASRVDDAVEVQGRGRDGSLAEHHVDLPAMMRLVIEEMRHGEAGAVRAFDAPAVDVGQEAIEEAGGSCRPPRSGPSRCDRPGERD